MKPTFISIKAEGFQWSDGFAEELLFRVIRESQARKYWRRSGRQRHLACFSSNGIRSNKGLLCHTCSSKNECQLKLRLHFKHDDLDYCLELPETSYENYRQYKRGLLESEQEVKTVITVASIIDRGYWGEVIFSLEEPGG